MQELLEYVVNLNQIYHGEMSIDIQGKGEKSHKKEQGLGKVQK